jgi:hypothetical protein
VPGTSVGKLDVNCAPAANVFVNEKKVGPSPVLGIQLPNGPHLVRCIHKDLGNKSQLVQIVGGATVSVSIRLEEPRPSGRW